MPTAAPHTRKDRGRTAACCCPACRGLESLERPRYFAGQLLTEAELSSEQEYVRAKSRLHNRYLHGAGVVCGLEVVCHECPGWVTVRPGYAIDPCGEDVIVPCEHPLDVEELIARCREAERRRTREDCEPWRAADPDCRDRPEVWCVTLSYEEHEARPTTALRRGRAACTCGGACGDPCRCGGHAHAGSGGHAHGSSGNGNGNGNGPVGSCTPGGLATCEPTRIVEGYRLDVVRPPIEGCLDGRAPKAWLGREVASSAWSVAGFLGGRMPARSWSPVAKAIVLDEQDFADSDVEPREAGRAANQFQRAVDDLYRHDPLRIRCAPPQKAYEPLQPYRRGQSAAKYRTEAQLNIRQSGAVMADYALRWLCTALLPPCPPAECDDRLVLACLTVDRGRVVEICNFTCRRHAGSFPAIFRALSLIPAVPIALQALRRMCCRTTQEPILPQRAATEEPGIRPLDSPELATDARRVEAEPASVEAFAEAFPIGRIDPDGAIRRALAADDFALARRYASKLGELRADLPRLLLGRLAARPEGVNVAGLVDRKLDEATGELESAGATAIVRELADPAEAPKVSALLAPAVAGEGDRVVLFAHRNRVVEVARVDMEAELADKDAQLAELRDEVRSLGRELAALKRRPRGGRSGGS